MNIFLLLNTLFLFYLGIVWQSNTIVNVVLKMNLLALSGWGGFLFLQALGYVVKV